MFSSLQILLLALALALALALDSDQPCNRPIWQPPDRQPRAPDLPLPERIKAHGAEQVVWYPDTRADSLPPYMLVSDPRLSHFHIPDLRASLINPLAVGVFRYSHTLVYKRRCAAKEVAFIAQAGPLTMSLVSGIGAINNGVWIQTSAIIERGVPFNSEAIDSAERKEVAAQIISLVAALHARGIVHGDVKPDNFVWAPPPREHELRIIDFGVARPLAADPTDWPAQRGTVRFMRPGRAGVRKMEDLPAATVESDWYGVAVSIWQMYAGWEGRHEYFSSNRGERPDLVCIDDEGLRSWVKETLKKGGLKVRDEEVSKGEVGSEDEVTDSESVLEDVNDDDNWDTEEDCQWDED